jgi:hypothetical protein
MRDVNSWPISLKNSGCARFFSLIQSSCEAGGVMAMMGPRQEALGALFHEFSLEDHVPANRQMRSIDRFVGLSGIRVHLAPF